MLSIIFIILAWYLEIPLWLQIMMTIAGGLNLLGDIVD